MKRIILSVFAAAVTAAWAIPAYAGDVTFSGQYRLRGEYMNNTDADYDDSTTPDESDSWTQRVRLTANVKAADDVSAKITVQDTRQWGGGLAALNTDTAGGNHLDLHEAYLNVTGIFGTPVDFRAGRQELAYGDERLIGAINWSNNGQAFDALKFMYSNDAVNVDVFTSLITEDALASNDDTSLHGIYATLKQLVPNNTLDVYFLNLTSGLSTANNLYTVGARLKGAAAGVDYTVELPFQFGDSAAGGDISAYAFAAKAGYTLPTPMKIRVGAEFDYGSGDDNALDTDTEAFVNLFPTNHAHFGIADIAGINWSNLMAWNVNASVDLNEKLRLFVSYWDFTANEVAAGADDDLGSEIDLVATYKYNNNVTLEAGAARFMPGEGTVGAGAPDDADDWAYVMITGNI
ncbi:hypothetical protein BAC1_00628 [uncultured bacterium]|nr:hypothetical protein BAC1_00628 [uncultured bacterium]